MGCYININSKGEKLPQIGKAQELINDGAIEVSGDFYQTNMICVVENGWMDAAVFVSNEEDFKYYGRPDDRPRTWLIYDNVINLINQLN